MRLQIADSCSEILSHLFAIALSLQVSAVVIIARITAKRRQCIRCKADEPRNCEPPRHVFDVWIQPAIFVNYNDARQFVVNNSGPGHIGCHDAAAVG